MALVCSAGRDWHWLLREDILTQEMDASTHKSSKDGTELVIKLEKLIPSSPKEPVKGLDCFPRKGQAASFSSRQYSGQPNRDHKR